MTIFAYPNTTDFAPQGFTWGVRSNDREFVSQMSGSVQTVGMPGTRWSAMLNFNNQSRESRPAVEAFFAKCRREHRIAMWNLSRPEPRGSINRTGVTLGSAAAQFSTQLVLAGCGANATIKAGDMLGVPGQLFMVADDATADGSGVMTVQLTHEVRAAQLSGAAVTLVRPTADFKLVSRDTDFPYAGTHYPAMAVELVEVFA